jgi:pSer/pThr/pTyr-binding forkhead associated (FHA) protein
MNLDALGLRIGSTETLILLAVVVGFAFFTRSSPYRRPLFAGRIELRVEEESQRKTVRLPLPITIGRSDDAQLRLNDPHASRLHAFIDVEEGTPFVEDLGSRNGTRVNARPISGRTTLAPGDDIRVGRAKIVFSGEVPWT